MPAFLQYPSWISPEIIPGFFIRWYAVMYLAAFAVAYLLFKYQVKKEKLGFSDDFIFNFFFFCILGLIVGARLFSVIFYDNDNYYAQYPWMAFVPFRDGRFTGFQGLSYHGGLVGALVGGVLYTRIKKMPTLFIGDILIHGIPLGYTFGRIGNFINGELWGRVTESPLGMVFPNAPGFPTSEGWVTALAGRIGMDIPVGAALLNLPRHPSMLYEAFFEGIFLWLVLWFVFRKKRKFDGQNMAIYLFGYGLVRFFIEYFREPDKGLGFIWNWSGFEPNPALEHPLLAFSMGQIFCLLMMVAGAVCFILFRRAALVKNRRLADEQVKKSNRVSDRKKRRRIK